MIYSIADERSLLSSPQQTFGTGPVWVEARAGLRRIYGLTSDILAALGKNANLAGKGRNQQEDRHLVQAWLRAQGTNDLVITQSQRLHPIILTNLAQLNKAMGTNLWLVHTLPIAENVHQRITRISTLAVGPAAVPKPAAVHAAVNRSRPQPLPWLKRALSANDFPTVANAITDIDHRFRNEFRRTIGNYLHALGRSANLSAGVDMALVDAVSTNPDDTNLLWEMRALQIAAWHHNILISIDITQLLASEERARHAITDIDQQLAAYRQPIRAVTVGLLARNIGLQTIANLAVGAVTPDGDIAIPDRDLNITTPLRRALLAQQHLQRIRGADENDALLPMATPRLAALATDAANDLNIHVIGRRAERADPRKRLLKRLGIRTLELNP